MFRQNLQMVQTTLCRLPRGKYWIGSDNLTNASPRHLRLLNADVWIDMHLVTWGDFEAFVCSGGYTNESLWQTVVGKPLPRDAIPESIDCRCDSLRTAATAFAACERPAGIPWRRMPATGLSWFEAAAICRFFNARMPFEAEWEAAVLKHGLLASGPGASIGRRQEWTLDRYASRYWRADESIRGNEWDSDREVVVRGHADNEPAVGPSGRRPTDPAIGSVLRGFRRVWEHDPREPSGPA